MNAWVWLAVAGVGGCGAVARVVIDAAVGERLSRRGSNRAAELAVGTFIINISGAFVLGLLDGIALTGSAQVIAGTAALGAFTTFSTWMLQSATLSRDGLRRAALANVGLSVLVGFGAVLLGRVVGVAL